MQGFNAKSSLTPLPKDDSLERMRRTGKVSFQQVSSRELPTRTSVGHSSKESFSG